MTDLMKVEITTSYLTDLILAMDYNLIEYPLSERSLSLVLD